MPKQRVEDLHRYFGWRDELIEAVRNGKRSRSIASWQTEHDRCHEGPGLRAAFFVRCYLKSQPRK